MQELSPDKRPHFARLLKLCEPLPPLKTALICPGEKTALQGALAARDENLIHPILVGDKARIIDTAKNADLDITGLEIVHAEGEEAAAHKGVDLVVEGRAEALMKGYIHSGTYLSAVIRRENGLRTQSRTSHCFVMDIPGWERPIIITDAALNVLPDVKNKIAITQNALNLATALQIDTPKAAILSAVEKPKKGIPSSFEAAEVAAAAASGEIIGGDVDGPFALDNAISVAAAKLKGIDSPVAGDADILVVPNVEAGNILFKALTFMAGAETAGLVVGASVPVILTSRADSIAARVASAALALLYARYLQVSSQG